MPQLSVYMITFNNERTLEKALKALQWADEIVVVDSFSTDRTMEIAQRYATKVEQREWPGFRDQYQYAADACSHEWLMFVDADEVIPEALETEIQEELKQNVARPEAERVAAYTCQRRTWYLDRWIQHGAWVPDREIRVYHRDQARWEGGLHAKLVTKGRIEEFKGVYLHYTYADVSDHLKTIDKYSSTAVNDMREAGKRFSLCKLLFNPFWRFFKEFILKRGFLDGFPGFVIAVNSSFYVFIKQVKLWEAEYGKDDE
jgi:glycosyltransferase involved in cell wall biosynthesis